MRSNQVPEALRRAVCEVLGCLLAEAEVEAEGEAAGALAGKAAGAAGLAAGSLLSALLACASLGFGESRVPSPAVVEVASAALDALGAAAARSVLMGRVIIDRCGLDVLVPLAADARASRARMRTAALGCLAALAHGSADAAEAIHAELGEGGDAPSSPTRPFRIPSLTPTSSRDAHASAGAVPRSSSNAAIPCHPSGASRACRASAHPSHMARSVAQASIATAAGARSLVSTSARPPTLRSVCCDAQSPVAQPRTAARAWHATRWLGASAHA